MSLVAYGDSDTDEDSVEEEVNKPSLKASSLSKTPRETVRITIPSLDQFKDEETNSNVIKKPQVKSGSGLFGLLPPPKYATSSIIHNFKPHVLTKQKQNQKKPLEMKSSTSNKNTTPVKTSTTEVDADDDPEPDDLPQENTSSAPGIDYFSLDSISGPAIHKMTDMPHTETDTKSLLFSTLPEPSQSTEFYKAVPDTQVPESLPLYTPELEVPSTVTEFEHQTWDDQGTSQTEGSASYLNDERFKKLKGRHRKEEITFIDVNAKDQLTGRDEWLMQSLTEEKVVRPSKRKHDMPTQQQKRKHQITYLAFQAKEREMDLKKQWSMNSQTRRETQAKYGF